MKKIIPVIGIEMHCELKSNSKVFSSARNCFSEEANSNIRPLDMAFPGTLPVVNKKCVKDALKMALVLNCQVPEYMYFDRKNYYYPDLPKGYQITQNTEPVGVNGYLDIPYQDGIKKVLIHDIHLEEDSASLEHYFDATLIDYNRAGVPLLELVTEPCFNSSAEVLAFLEYIKTVYQYCDVSEADTKKGQIRCDVNVSIMPENATTLGTKVEIKNVNGFGNVVEAIEYEIKRQTELMNAGKYDLVEQETRRFDEETGETYRMRSKVDAIDYKYFIEPNIPKYKITHEWLEKIKKEIPILPLERQKLYTTEYGLSEVDTNILIKDKSLADYFEECLNLGIDAKVAANWLITQILGYLNKKDLSIEEIYLTPKRLKELITYQNKGLISSKQAKEIFNQVLTEEKEVATFIKEENAQISDKDELTQIIKTILDNNPEQIKQYHNGKTNLFDYFVGQVMRETKGKANPVLTKEILTKLLGEITH